MHLKGCELDWRTYSNPLDGDDLCVYLAASNRAVAAVLIKEEGSIQRPVYYVSKALSDVETRYFNAEKVDYALVIASRKLRAYFLAHSITMLTDSPLRKILQQPESSGRLLTWSNKLSEFDIKYEARRAIKAQALIEFILEASFTKDVPEKTDSNLAQKPRKEKRLITCEFDGELENFWKLHVDGSSAKGGSGAGISLITPEGMKFEKALRFKFVASNNQAEYEALVVGLKLAGELGVNELRIYSDSQLVVKQVKGEYGVV